MFFNVEHKRVRRFLFMQKAIIKLEIAGVKMTIDIESNPKLDSPRIFVIASHDGDVAIESNRDRRNQLEPAVGAWPLAAN
jgi:hypothetical protein